MNWICCTTRTTGWIIHVSQLYKLRIIRAFFWFHSAYFKNSTSLHIIENTFSKCREQDKTSYLISHSTSVWKLDFFQNFLQNTSLANQVDKGQKTLTQCSTKHTCPRLLWEHDFYFMVINQRLTSRILQYAFYSPILMVCSYSDQDPRGIQRWKFTPQ